MRALVVYESIFGNTRDVAASIASGLRERALDVVVAEVSDAPGSAEDFDLVVVGGPIHAWGMTRAGTRDGARQEAEREHLETVSQGEGIREWMQRLPDVSTPIRCATFDTQTKTSWFPTGSAARPAAKKLREHGFELIADPEHFLVEGKYGPMIDGEVERARDWAAALVEA
ncbi:MAG: hypothetical protein KUG77_21590 [Nannocystaceae bacterium]|nr:hypothetical protein [Nannocystaceae bacterium]